MLRAAAIDREGDLVMAPTLTSEGQLGDGEVAPGLSLIKLKRDGSLRWSRLFSANTEAFVRAIEVTDEGSYVVAGTFAGEIGLGEVRAKSRGDRDAFVALFSQEGELRWIRSLGGLAREQATTLAISDEAQGITMGGWAESSFHFAGKEYSGRGIAKDGFVATYDFGGTPLWARRYHGVGVDKVHALSYDVDELTVLGSFSTLLQFGSETVRTQGKRDIFCVRYESDGSRLWHQAWGSTKFDLPVDMSVSSSGQIRALSVIEGDITIGGESWPSLGESDLLLWSLNASGEVQHSKRLGGSGAEYATDAEPGEGLALAGYYTGPGQFAQHTLPAPLQERGFLLRLDSDFSVLAARDLDYDRLLLVKQRFAGQLLVGLWQGRVKLHFEEL